MKIVLTNNESSLNPDSKELANLVLDRTGLIPRKKGSTKDMYKVLIELYERQKRAKREKDHKISVLTVEEMSKIAGITPQTMYEYLGRWLTLNVLKKVSFMLFGKIVIGYSLNGDSIEDAFSKAKTAINMNIDGTANYIKLLQKELKNEKLRKGSEESDDVNEKAADEIEKSSADTVENSLNEK